MATNKFIGGVDVECGSDIYVFKSDFSFLESLNQSVGDPMEIYIDFCSGKTDPNQIKGVMVASIKAKNGNVVPKPPAEVERLITRNGLQECWALCRHLLAYAMIGDEKKSELLKLKPNKLSRLITEPFRLENSRNRRLLWAYHAVISVICVCISISLLELLTALKTG